MQPVPRQRTCPEAIHLGIPASFPDAIPDPCGRRDRQCSESCTDMQIAPERFRFEELARREILRRYLVVRRGNSEPVNKGQSKGTGQDSLITTSPISYRSSGDRVKTISYNNGDRPRLRATQAFMIPKSRAEPGEEAPEAVVGPGAASAAGTAASAVGKAASTAGKDASTAGCMVEWVLPAPGSPDSC
jgi:hypothetical protein